MDRQNKIIKTSIIGIIVNLILVAFKATIGILVNSIAITLDAVNNLTDALSSIITIIGAKLAGKAPDKKHPHGYGRIEYFSSIIIAIIINSFFALLLIFCIKFNLSLWKKAKKCRFFFLLLLIWCRFFFYPLAI